MIKIQRLSECDNPKFIKPKRIFYTQEGKEKSWEILQTHDSVAILLFDMQKEVFILVKQFRPAIYVRNGDGYTYELCAGLIDKEKDIVTIAKEEIFEECGYDVAQKDIYKISSFYTAVGFAGGKQTLFFAEIDDSMRVHEGGGIDDENIEVISLPFAEARDFMYDENKVKTPGLLFAFMWFFDKYKK